MHCVADVLPTGHALVPNRINRIESKGQLIRKRNRTMEVIHSDLDGVPCEYHLLDKLGEGGFSKVYKCERIMNGKKEIFVPSSTRFSWFRLRRSSLARF